MEHTLRNHLATKPKNWPATAQANPDMDTKWKIMQSNTMSQRNNQPTSYHWMNQIKQEETKTTPAAANVRPGVPQDLLLSSFAASVPGQVASTGIKTLKLFRCMLPYYVNIMCAKNHQFELSTLWRSSKVHPSCKLQSPGIHPCRHIAVSSASVT